MEENRLFPIFLKLEHLQMLLIGGGNVGLEKLEAILRNSPEAKVHIVATYFHPELLELCKGKAHIQIEQRTYQASDLEGKDLVIMATDQPELHAQIKEACAARHLLANVADTPHLCDFYLGSVVKKGNLKIAISTNGKSPTLAKRIRGYLEEAIPEDVEELMKNLKQFRDKLKGDFQAKVIALNEATKSLVYKNDEEK